MGTARLPVTGSGRWPACTASVSKPNCLPVNRSSCMDEPLSVGRRGAGPLTQHVLAHLAGRGLRQLTELDGVRGLEARQVPAGERDELVRVELRIRSERDVGPRALAPRLV